MEGKMWEKAKGYDENIKGTTLCGVNII